MGIIGTYLLALWLDRPRTISVGRLGAISFSAGWYLYVGSARGPGGLRARLARHLRRLGAGKQAHWHVDSLREAAAWAGAWGHASDENLECGWAGQLCGLALARIAVPSFGASDCHCPGHLVFVPDVPSDIWLAEKLGAERIWMGDGELEDLLVVLTSGDEPDREAAALALGRYGADAVPALSTLVGSDDPNARWWAARALAETGGDGAVAPLVTALADADPDVRACAALALGRLGASAAVPYLAPRLADDSPFVAGVAADALSMIGELAIPALAEMLDHERPHTRLLAVRALLRTKSQSAAVPLFGVLEDPSYLVRFYAQEALDSLGAGMVYFSR